MSVKDRQVTRADLEEAIERIEGLADQWPRTWQVTLRIEAASTDTRSRSLYEVCRRLQELALESPGPDFERAKVHFEDRHQLSSFGAMRLVVSDRRLSTREAATRAAFSHA